MLSSSPSSSSSSPCLSCFDLGFYSSSPPLQKLYEYSVQRPLNLLNFHFRAKFKTPLSSRRSNLASKMKLTPLSASAAASTWEGSESPSASAPLPAPASMSASAPASALMSTPAIAQPSAPMSKLMDHRLYR